jgi:hypothetical protein
MRRHLSSNFGEIGFAGAGFVDELTVKHYGPTIRQFEQFVEILADHRGEIEPQTGIAGDRPPRLRAGRSAMHGIEAPRSEIIFRENIQEFGN